MSYPKARFHASKPSVVVKTAAEEQAMAPCNGGWSDQDLHGHKPVEVEVEVKPQEAEDLEELERLTRPDEEKDGERKTG